MITDNTEELQREENRPGPSTKQADIPAAIRKIHYFTAGEGALADYASNGERFVEENSPLHRLTFCVLTLHNGFTVVGKSACVDSSNYNREHGQEYAFNDAVRNLGPLLGFRLAEKLANEQAQAV